MSSFVNLLENNAAHRAFDGTNRYRVPTNLFPAQGSDYSVCYWLKWDQPDQEWDLGKPLEYWTCVFRKTNNQPDGSSHSRIPACFINSTVDTIAGCSGHSVNWNVYDKGNVLQRHKWYHITHAVSNTNQTSTIYVYDPSTAKCEIVETSLTGTVNTSDDGYFYIGGDEFFTGFIGVLADMRWYYDTALSPKQASDIASQLKHTACCIAEEEIAVDFQLEHGGCIELEDCLISNFTIDVTSIPTIIDWNVINNINEPYAVDLDALFEPLHTEQCDEPTQLRVLNGILDDGTPVLHDLQDRYEKYTSGEKLEFDTKYKTGDGIDIRHLFAAWGTTSSLAYVRGTPGFVGFTDLGWEYTIETDNGVTVPNNATYKYEISTDPFMVDIVKEVSKSDFTNSHVFSDLTPYKEYYSRLTIMVPDGKDSISNISRSITNPCGDFHARRLDDNTIRVVSDPNIKIAALEDKSPTQKMRGLVRPVANDQFGYLFIAVGEGLSRTKSSDRGGRIVFDAGFLKFGSRSGGSITNKWSEAYRTDLYNRPGQWAYLYNALKYISRDTKTNKVLLIAEQHKSNHYHAPEFMPGVAGICEAYLDKTVSYLDGSSGDHLAVIKASSRSSNDWRDYFKQFDCVLYFGTRYTKNVEITTPFVDGLLDYIDSGGGLFTSTDHTTTDGKSFAKNINQVVQYYGVQFISNKNRTTNHSAYNVGKILKNSDYIPGGWHPLFDGLKDSSYIHAGNSEGVIAYDNSSSSTTILTTDKDGIADINTNTLGKVIIRTANDCGTMLY